jgi:hypothetical protein
VGTSRIFVTFQQFFAKVKVIFHGEAFAHLYSISSSTYKNGFQGVQVPLGIASGYRVEQNHF